jgi:alpha-1,2-mannosyltransferase
MNVATRLRDYWRIAQMMMAYATIAVVWYFVLNQFIGIIRSRLHHIALPSILTNDRPCARPECDFSMFWPSGLLARSNEFAALYKPESFWLFRQHILNQQASRIDWIYPPPTLLLSMGISYLPFEVGFLIWSFVFLMLSILLLRWARVSWLAITLTLLSPATLWNFEMGQLGTIEGVVLASGLLMIMKTPLSAGGLLGFLIFKPQAAFLLPVVVLSKHNRSAVFGAVLSAGLVIGVVSAMLGWQAWIAFFTEGRVAAKEILEKSFFVGYQQFGVSVFWMLRSFGTGLFASYLGQGVSSVIAIFFTWQIWQEPEIRTQDRVSLTVFLSLMTTPYGFTYDMVGYCVALIILAEGRGWRIDLLDALFWLWPALCPIVTVKIGVLLTPVIVALAVIRTWMRAGLTPQHFPVPSPVLPRAQ